MADNYKSTVIIDVSLTPEDAAARAEEVSKKIADIRKEQDALKKANQQSSVAYAQNQQALRTLNAEQKAYIAISQNSLGSNNQLRAQLSLLSQQYNALSREERDNTVAGKALQVQIRGISDELKRSEGAVGDNRRNVGNYTDSIKDATASTLPFGDSIVAALDKLNSFKGIIEQVRAVQKAQAEATELQTVALQQEEKAALAAANAEREKVRADEMQAAADAEAAEASRLRVQADELQLQITNQLIAAEQREIAVNEQLAAAEAALTAETRALAASNEALAASASATAAAMTAQAEAATAAATAQAAQGAAAEASALKTGTLKKAAGAGVFAILLASVAAVIDYFKQFNNTADSIEQKLAGMRATFQEFGAVISEVFTGKGLSAFNNFAKRLSDADKAAQSISSTFQDLDDVKDVTEQLNQQAQAEVDNLRLRARNRSLDADQRQKLLNEASRLEDASLKRTQKYYDQFLDAAIQFANKRGNLSKEEIEGLKRGDINVANSLDQQSKISADAYDKLKEAFANRVSATQLHNQRLEKLQNDQDRIAEQNKDAEERRRQALAKINEDRVKSELTMASLLLTARQKEAQDINADIDRRIKMYRDYGQSTVKLEEERTARLKALNKKFHEEDLKVIQGNVNEAEKLRISTLADGYAREQAEAALNNRIALQQVDEQIAAINNRIASGEQGLTDILQSFVDKRNAIVETGNLQREQIETNHRQNLLEIQRQVEAEQLQQLQNQLNYQSQITQGRLQMDAEVLKSQEDLTGTIAGLFTQQSEAAKLFFLLSRAFAIAEIAINAQREVAAVNLRYELLKVQAAAVPFAGPFLVSALATAQAVETGKVIGRAVISGAFVAATAIQSVIQGKARGGLHYDSDGRGAILVGPGTGKSDSMNARLSNGEAVINAESTAMYKPLLSAINQAGGGVAFAGGGVYNAPVPSFSTSVINQAVDQAAIVNAIGKIQIITDVKDVIGAINARNNVTKMGDF